jgi:hypothetical protein
MSFGEEKMSDAAILSRLAPIIRAKKIFWINGEYFREGEVVHRECFVKLLDEAVRIGFDEYLEKYEDAVDLYDAYVREELPDVEAALLFILNSFPRVAEKLRAG